MEPLARIAKSEENEISPFVKRHIGPSPEDIASMLSTLGCSSLEDFISKVIPARLRTDKFKLPFEGMTEDEALETLKAYSEENKIFRSLIGQGYYDTITPGVILRNIFENPGWYTQYTPYQPEISQGRLEALLNFQTMISDLTGLPISNSSLLDEGTAAAEAMSLSRSDERNIFIVDGDCHPQTIAVVKTRAKPLGIEVRVTDSFDNLKGAFGILLQYPGSSGAIRDFSGVIKKAKEEKVVVTMATDLLALTLIPSPGELGADIAVGSAQRFGVPLGFGGPHAAFFATTEAYKRQIPGRIVGVSKDSNGKRALRLALQTREQHIRREKATSNICTAQVLPSIMASMYAVYHGPNGLKDIALRVNYLASKLAATLKGLGYKLASDQFFDTVKVQQFNGSSSSVLSRARAANFNLREYEDGSIGISLDELSSEEEIEQIVSFFTGKKTPLSGSFESIKHYRTSEFLTHPVFNSYHSETEFLRYVKRLESRDLSLCHAMIPLGSCTMKLNATAEMIPVSYPGFSKLHPFAPKDQTLGYQRLFKDLEDSLCAVTGFDAVSLQPNAGSQGEYAGLLVIREYQESVGESYRDVCLIPKSAHGTNPASAVMAGLKVVGVECDSKGNIDIEDLKLKIDQNEGKVSCIMVTYPSTHGVFEGHIQEVSKLVHDAGGQVYMDGANLNALVGYVTSAGIGADVCHINLHKTFCIPHGGGGPGMGPIAVKKHLVPFLPGHPITGGILGPVSSAPWGSASILPISWAYMAMMGTRGVTLATAIGLLSANYIAKRVEQSFPVLYKGESGFVAHECILDLRSVKASAGIEVDDIAKRLIDYGFHPPTVSWPVAGTIMVEPTESESKAELDRFCEALISIREEIREIESGNFPKEMNPLKGAPHTIEVVTANDWGRPYSREQAAYPVPALREFKFWPSVGRVDAAFGDRNLVCTCPSVEELSA
jgi:glycine dehydrogenase